MLYERELFKELIARIKEKEIIVITGMRRVGKTTLLQMIFDRIESKNKAFFDMENPLNQKIFEEENYDNIWANLKPFGVNNNERAFIFIDEIQAKPDITQVIKYLYDHYEIKFFLTGSSSFYLKNLFPESLSGRKIIFDLYPLSFKEFLLFKNYKKNFYDKFKDKEKNKNKIEYERVKKFYEEYLEYGGFPQVILADEIEKKKEFLIDVFRSYFEKEVQVLSDFREINSFRDLILLLLKRIGTKLDVSKLSSELGLSRETIYSYISFLEKTYFISLITPLTKSIDREVSKRKKIYACDNGIARHIGKCEEGNLLENAAFNNLKKYGEIKYYEKRIGGEIDFILNEKIALEVKQRGDERDIVKMRKIAKDLKLNECYLISKEFKDGRGFIIASDI